MDLIDRKAAIEALGERPTNWTDSQEEIEAVRAYDNAVDSIKYISSVPAVPLDKLCEWLKENALDITQRNVTPMKTSAEHWKRVLTKWMEGLDDNRRIDSLHQSDG